MEEFDIRELRPSERTPLLEELAQNASVAFHAGALNQSEPVSFSHQTRRFRDIELTQTKFTNYLGERSIAQAHDLAEPRIVITVSHGEVNVEQSGIQTRATATSIVPIWSISPWKVAVPSPSLFRGFSIPMKALGLPHLLVRNLMGQDLGSSPLGSFLARYLSDLSALPPLDSENESALAAPSTDIVRAFLTAAAGDEFRSREPLGMTLGLRVLAYLKTHATDTDLTADRVAAHFGISRRYLFVVMRQRGVSMQEWVREERLRRAAHLLIEPSNARVSVSAVGRLCGFVDHSSFTRAFRGRFGYAPSEWHMVTASERARLQRDRDWLHVDVS
jgi:AraC-like DNA-binding protein